MDSGRALGVVESFRLAEDGLRSLLATHLEALADARRSLQLELQAFVDLGVAGETETLSRQSTTLEEDVGSRPRPRLQMLAPQAPTESQSESPMAAESTSPTSPEVSSNCGLSPGHSPESRRSSLNVMQRARLLVKVREEEQQATLSNGVTSPAESRYESGAEGHSPVSPVSPLRELKNSFTSNGGDEQLDDPPKRYESFTEDILRQVVERLNNGVELCEIWKERRRIPSRIARVMALCKPVEIAMNISETSWGSSDNCLTQLPSMFSKLRAYTVRSAKTCARRVITRPTSTRCMVWGMLGMILILHDLVVVPLEVFDPPKRGADTVMSWATTVFWTLDIPFSFSVGFHHRGLLEMKLKKIAAHYGRTWLTFDVLVVSADWAVVFMTSVFDVGDGSISQMDRGVQVLRFLRLLRLLKLRTLIAELFERIQAESVRILIKIAQLIIFIVIVNHLLACGFYGVGVREDIGPTWVYKSDAIATAELGYRYATAMHWSLTQFTPASMEVVPTNVVERVYTICTLLFAMCTFTSFIGSITMAMTRLRNLNSEEHAQRAVLRKFLKQSGVTTELSNMIWSWLEHCRATTTRRIHEEKVYLLKLLPKLLLSQVQTQIYGPLLERHPFFACFCNAHPYALRKLFQILSQAALLRGQELFNIGDPATHMHFVFCGTMVYTTDLVGTPRHSWKSSQLGTLPVADPNAEGRPTVVSANHWVAEPALWIKWQHCGHLTAKSHCELFAIQATKFQQLMQRDLLETWQPARYAKLYAHYVSERKADLDDVWMDVDRLQEIATQAFQESGEFTSPGSSPGRSSVSSQHSSPRHSPPRSHRPSLASEGSSPRHSPPRSRRPSRASDGDSRPMNEVASPYTSSPKSPTRSQMPSKGTPHASKNSDQVTLAETASGIPTGMSPIATASVQVADVGIAMVTI